MKRIEALDWQVYMQMPNGSAYLCIAIFSIALLAHCWTLEAEHNVEVYYYGKSSNNK